METLTSRKRLKRCYGYKEVDRPGVYSRTGFPSNDPSYNKLKSYLRQYSDLKKGWHPDIVKHSYNIKTYSEDFERKITVYNTNMGEFKSSRLVGLKGQPGDPALRKIFQNRKFRIALSLALDKSVFYKILLFNQKVKY